MTKLILREKIAHVVAPTSAGGPALAGPTVLQLLAPWLNYKFVFVEIKDLFLLKWLEDCLQFKPSCALTLSSSSVRTVLALPFSPFSLFG